jgi:imidazolonepropionase-like amidohydrolase
LVGLVIEAGTVHPFVSCSFGWPAIARHGVVVVRGENASSRSARRASVGRPSKCPAERVRAHVPDGHVYPGLVDAATDAFTDGRRCAPTAAWMAAANSPTTCTSAATAATNSSAAGITTAYVTVRSPAQMRGQGAIVRPTRRRTSKSVEGQEHASLQLRMTNGPGATHPLQRQQQLDGGDLFDGLDEYRKALTTLTKR